MPKPSINVPKDEAEVVAKKLYRHKSAGPGGGERWSEFADIGKEQKALLAAASKYPIVHRHVHDKRTRNSWKTSEFTINDKAIKALVRAALVNYPQFDPDNPDDWTFEPPYRPLLHRWEQLNDLCKEVTEEAHKEAADRLLSFLRPVLKSELKVQSLAKETNKVWWDDVWHIFPPGEITVTTFYGVETLAKVVRCVTELLNVGTAQEEHCLIITLQFVDWNGEYCGLSETKVHLKEYVGLRRVLDLPAYPLSFHEDPDALRKKMLERGRKFEKLRGYQFRMHSGIKILLDCPEPEEKQVGMQAPLYPRTEVGDADWLG
jgi:hypothetical protein